MSSLGTSNDVYWSGGYWCSSCGQWVAHGLGHVCITNPYTQPYIPTITTTWTPEVPSVPTIKAFKGAVKDTTELPTKAAQGDAYYVEKSQALVVRQQGGWFHFDKS